MVSSPSKVALIILYVTSFIGALVDKLCRSDKRVCRQDE